MKQTRLRDLHTIGMLRDFAAKNSGILRVRSHARPKPLAKLGKIIFFLDGALWNI